MTKTKVKQSWLQWWTKKRIITVVVAVIVVFGVYELGRHLSYWGNNDELRAIKSEKLVKDDLFGLKLLEEHTYGEGALFSKTISPSVYREFYLDGENYEPTRDKIIQYAEADGWVHNPSIVGENDWWGRKKVGRFDLALVISVTPNRNLIRVEVL